MVDYDEAGSIGKRYRRQDEIGTPSVHHRGLPDRGRRQDPRRPLRHRPRPGHHGAGPSAHRPAEGLYRGEDRVLIKPSPGGRWLPLGAPARAQRSGSCGERTSSGVNEACRLRRAERYAACEDDGLRRPTFQRGKVGKARHGATGAEGPFQGQTRPFPPGTPLSEMRIAAEKFNEPPYLRAVTMPVRCPPCRSPSARAELPAQTCKLLQFKGRSQCRTGPLRRVSVSDRVKPSPWGEGGICAANDG